MFNKCKISGLFDKNIMEFISFGRSTHMSVQFFFFNVFNNLE